MKRLAIGAALLALGLAAGSARADDKSATVSTKEAPWYKRWFGIGPEPIVAPPPKKRDPAAEAASIRAAAEADLNRRVAVCDQLRQIAFENGDSRLNDRALELEQQAWEIYRRRTAQLPCNRLVPTEEERSLDSKLIGSSSTATAADRLAPKGGVDTSRKTQASAIREVKP
jgi:hypothetical protein